MIGHYVDDDELDVLSVKNMLSAEHNFALTSSNSLSDISEWLEYSDVDFILIDINRPDSTSLEKDYDDIRKYSQAPVIFITGDNANKYREQATEAGAEGVIEKDGLSLDLLQQILLNVVARSKSSKHNITSPHSREFVIDKEGQIASDKLSLALSYLETSLAKTEDIDLSKETSQKLLEPIRQAATSLKLYISPNPETQQNIPTPKILRSLQSEAFALAAERDVKIAIQLSKSGFAKMRSKAVAQAGLQHLLDGVIKASQKGDSISFVTAPTDHGLSVTISSNRIIIPDFIHVFSKRSPVYLKHYEAMQSLNLAALLLDLSFEDFEILSHRSVQRIKVNIIG